MSFVEYMYKALQHWSWEWFYWSVNT